MINQPILLLIFHFVIQQINGYNIHSRPKRVGITPPNDAHLRYQTNRNFTEYDLQVKVERGREMSRHIAELFVTQSSSENPGWESAATELYAMMKPDIRIGYCGVAQYKSINLMQFMAEQTKRREQYSKTKVDQTPKLDYSSNTVATTFFLDYNQTNKNYKQTSNTRFYVSTIEKDGRYVIQSLVYSAPCLEHGETYDPLVYYERINPAGLGMFERTDYFGEFVNKQTAEYLVHNWGAVMGHDEYFSGSICNKTDKYTKEEFINYMRLFYRRWINTRNMSDTQLFIDGYRLMYETPDYLKFRIRRVMQMNHDYWIDNEDLREEWNIKFEAKHNQHGDGKWWITTAELACPLFRATSHSLREDYANALVDDVFELMKREFNDSGVWYIAYDLIRDYTKQDDKDISSKICHTNDPINYPTPMWIFKMSMTTNRITVSREAIRTLLNDTILQFTIRTSVKEDGFGYKSVDWMFTYEFDNKWDTWYMKHIEITCPFIARQNVSILNDFIAEHANEIGTTVWSSMLDKNEFGGRVCQDLNRDYNSVEFTKYMRLFFQRWKYTNETTRGTIKVTMDQPEQYIFKYTMKLKLDDRTDGDMWSLGISAKYNMHGDNKWYINNMHLECPKGINLRDRYGHVQVNKLIDGMKTEILLNGDWIYAYEFVRNLEKGAKDRIVVTDCNNLEMHSHGLKWWSKDMITNKNLTATFKDATDYKIDGDLLKFSVRSDIHEKGKTDQTKDLAIEMSYDVKYDRWWITALKVGCTSKRSMKEEEEGYNKYEVEDREEGGHPDDIEIHNIGY